MRKEVDSLLSPLGLHFVWRPVVAEDGNEVFLAVVVIHFSGECATADLHPIGPHALWFGNTHIEGNRVLPFSEVNCNEVRRAAASHLRRFYNSERDRMFGRALGRVVAHELFHIFTRSIQHGSDGVAKSEWSAGELTFGGFRFGEGDYRNLRTSVLPILKQMAGLPSPKAPPSLPVFVESGCSGCHGAHAEGTRWAPSLRKQKNIYDPARLAEWLKDSHSKMYRRARGLHVPWGPVTDSDVRDLATFLSGLKE